MYQYLINNLRIKKEYYILKMKRKVEKSFLELNEDYLLIYMRYLKDAKIWESMGQYWLAKESRNRALSLLNSDIDEAKKPDTGRFIKSSQYLIFPAPAVSFSIIMDPKTIPSTIGTNGHSNLLKI